MPTSEGTEVDEDALWREAKRRAERVREAQRQRRSAAALAIQERSQQDRTAALAGPHHIEVEIGTIMVTVECDPATTLVGDAAELDEAVRTVVFENIQTMHAEGTGWIATDIAIKIEHDDLDGTNEGGEEPSDGPAWFP